MGPGRVALSTLKHSETSHKRPRSGLAVDTQEKQGGLPSLAGASPGQLSKQPHRKNVPSLRSTRTTQPLLYQETGHSVRSWFCKASGRTHRTMPLPTQEEPHARAGAEKCASDELRLNAIKETHDHSLQLVPSPHKATKPHQSIHRQVGAITHKAHHII